MLRWSALVALSLCAGLSIPASAVTFADGQLHVIDAANSFPFEPAIVADGPSEAATTLSIVDGGEIGTVTEDSLSAEGHSIVTMTGGEIGRNLFARHSSLVTVSGGLIRDFLAADGDSTVEILGGSHNGLLAGGSSRVSIRDGTLSNMFVLRSDGSALVRILGGALVGEKFMAEDASKLEILGGSIQVTLLALEQSSITIVGRGFNYPVGPLPSSGTLIGTLADGTPIATTFGHASGATITLVDAPLALATCFDERAACEEALDMCNATVIGSNGDFNGDGVANLVDVSIYRRWLAGYPVP